MDHRLTKSRDNDKYPDMAPSRIAQTTRDREQQSGPNTFSANGLVDRKFVPKTTRDSQSIHRLLHTSINSSQLQRAISDHRWRESDVFSSKTKAGRL